MLSLLPAIQCCYSLIYINPNVSARPALSVVETESSAHLLHELPLARSVTHARQALGSGPVTVRLFLYLLTPGAVWKLPESWFVTVQSGKPTRGQLLAVATFLGNSLFLTSFSNRNNYSRACSARTVWPVFKVPSSFSHGYYLSLNLAINLR